MRRVLGEGPMGMLDRTLWVRIVLAAAPLLLLLAGRSSGEDRPAGDDPTHGYQHPGVRDLLPAFREGAARRQSFPYSWPEWSKRNGRDFGHWRRGRALPCPQRQGRFRQDAPCLGQPGRR